MTVFLHRNTPNANGRLTIPSKVDRVTNPATSGPLYPIRAASTEEECVRLAARTLDRPDSDFLARLVQAGELTVYGSRLPDGTEVLALCAGFDAHLGPHAPDARPPALAEARR